MKIGFHGAARYVTGSKHLITLKNNTQILLDCGLFQGSGPQTDSLNREWGFKPSEVNYLILSHAHIDHSGLIPKLVKDGFKGTIYCTPATLDLTQILLYDSAHIQEMDSKFVNKRRAEQGKPLLKPLYLEDDVNICLSLFKAVDYNQVFKINEFISFQFTDVGHIVGSAAVHLDIVEDKELTKITFTGDIGRYNTSILRSPQNFRQADYILCESTYGDRLHDEQQITSQQILDAIKYTCLEKKGKLIIPAFSVGRTQEILFALNTLEIEGKLPNLDYIVDSPLSTDATTILKNHKECYNKKIIDLMKNDKDPFDFTGLHFTLDSMESKSLNQRQNPFVVISASGMAEAGRVKHHIAHAIGDEKNTILIVGYCEPHSLGGHLMNGDKVVRIYGEEFHVNADVQVIRSFSAHGDYNDICQYLACQDLKLVKKLFLVHGEYETQKNFQTRLLKKGFFEVDIPQMHEEVYL